MLGIGKRIETLGISLSNGFNKRARHHFEKASGADEKSKPGMMLVALVMTEIANVIAEVTAEKGADDEG